MEGIFKCLPLKHPTQLPPQKGARTTPEGPPWSSEVLHPAKAMTRMVMETSALSGLKNNQCTERFPGGREPGWLSWGAGAAPCPGGAGGLHVLPWSPGPTQGLTTVQKRRSPITGSPFPFPGTSSVRKPEQPGHTCDP